MYHIFDTVKSSWNAVCYKARMEPMYCGAGGHDAPLFNPRPRGGRTSVYRLLCASPVAKQRHVGRK